MAYQEYPKQMTHPQYRPAVVSGYKRNADGSATNDPPGQPAKFPPVMVNNRDQEQEYASRGYLPAGVSDPQAYLRATIGADNPGTYKFQEYPKWLYRADEDGEVKSEMVHSAAQEQRLGKGWHATPDAAREAVQQDEVTTNDAPTSTHKPAAKKAKNAPKRKYTRLAKAAEAPAAEPAPEQ